MFKKKYLGLAIAATLAAGAAQAALETSVTLKNETAYMLKDGIRTGEATSQSDTTGEGKGVYKFENTAKIFLNDELESGGSWHGELNIVRDSKAINDYQGHETNTQRDWLRELYVDKTFGDWDVRLGKQQVVWGTADGIKLLDMINPTDWSEFNQNTPADARIPVWMVNAEKYLDNGGNIQVILSQAEANKIAGLNASGDQGHPFVMKGVDSITGKVNGFLNVAPALAGVASTFDFAAQYKGFATSDSTQSNGLAAFTSMTVDGFASNTDAASSPGGYFVLYAGTSAALAAGTGSPLGTMLGKGQSRTFSYAELSTATGVTITDANVATYTTLAASRDTTNDEVTYTYDGTNITNSNGFVFAGSELLYGMSENGATGYTTYANGGATNLVNSTWNVTTPDAAFEYMPMATFATFNTLSKLTTTYIKDHDEKPNLAFRFKDSSVGGVNFSFNYANRSDSNPYIDLFYRDRDSKERLSTVYVQGGYSGSGAFDGTTPTNAGYYTGLPVIQTSGVNSGTALVGTEVTAASIPSNIYSSNVSSASAYSNGAATNAVTVLLKDGSGNFYGAKKWDYSGSANSSYDQVELVFEEKLNRTHNIGGSFDFAVETADNPVVVRGEWLYTKDEMMPVVDKRVLAIGDLAGALKMEKADTFKYVIGADVTVATDLFLSGQFIQFRNLDYVDTPRTCVTQMNNSIDCSKYTADMATLSMSNQLQKGEENKNFYSMYLSKPFGESGEGRWNNIFIYEEGGGKWNRFDVEYGINDQLIGTFEYNKYFGDENTMFGQFENASNVQVGLKYLFE